MSTLLDDFDYRKSLLDNINYTDSVSRLSGFWSWVTSDKTMNDIIQNVLNTVDVDAILKKSDRQNPPQESAPEEIAAIGFNFLSAIASGTEPYKIAYKHGIEPSYSTGNAQDVTDEVFNRFIEPSLEYIRRELEKIAEDEQDEEYQLLELSQNIHQPPPEIFESLRKFQKDNPFYERNAFIMMQFGGTKAHKNIVASINSTLNTFNINGFRADDKEYHDDLFGNVLTYLYGCSFGIAVFERLEADDFNPNVSLEVGYMRALKKSVCLLKDKTLPTLQTDLVGKLYKAFDPQNPKGSIPDQLEKWLRDKDIIIL